MRKTIAAFLFLLLVMVVCSIKVDAEETEPDGFWPLVYIVHAEANNQDLTGKKLVADVVLNRVHDPRFPNTIEGVIFQPYQFSPIRDGSYERAKTQWTQEDYDAVVCELIDQVDYDVLYFSAGGYLPYGTPAYKYGGHYFCR